MLNGSRNSILKQVTQSLKLPTNITMPRKPFGMWKFFPLINYNIYEKFSNLE